VKRERKNQNERKISTLLAKSASLYVKYIQEQKIGRELTKNRSELRKILKG
jgi:hypothetical protein